jgi:hypothetical protein
MEHKQAQKIFEIAPPTKRQLHILVDAQLNIIPCQLHTQFFNLYIQFLSENSHPFLCSSATCSKAAWLLEGQDSDYEGGEALYYQREAL